MKISTFYYPLFFAFSLFFISATCIDSTSSNENNSQTKVLAIDSSYKTIHIFVALCDNKYQGIVPVPARIGNGQDLNNNLYWGCGYGIRTYFKKSKDWKLIRTRKINEIKMERLLFQHVSKKYFLVADAYNGMNIKECTIDFLRSCSGKMKDTVHVQGKIIGINGYSNLLSYIGHDGLMDFSLSESFQNTDNKQRDCIILACISKSYFAPFLKQAKANPLVWTTGLMCPEAYTVHDAIHSYLQGESTEKIRNAAALAYSSHQKCSLKAAKNLLVSGF